MRTILIIAIALSSFGAMAQIDTSKVPVPSVYVPPSAFQLSTDSTTIQGSGIVVSDAITDGFRSSGLSPLSIGTWTTKVRTLLVSYPNRVEWSIGPVDKNGNAKVYVKRSMVRWLNDSTMYISTAIHKPVKKKSKIKHMRRLADGTFYLKELKPGETAVISIPVKIK